MSDIVSSRPFADETTVLHAAERFGLTTFGNIHTHTANNTTDVFEQRVAELEGGVAAVAVASGQAAQTLAILNLAEAGDNIVASQSRQDGTSSLFSNTLPRLGIRTKFVNIHDLKAVAGAIDDKTRALYVETVGNPALDVPDLEALARLAHDFNLPLVVDNTFAAALVKPIAHGADIVLHSATEWVGAHGTSVGGVIVDAGRFDWGATARFRRFYNEPEPTYHGLRFAEAFGNVGGANIAFATRLRALLLRDIGASLSPLDAFLFLQALETLPRRIRQHSANALRVARFLEAHPAVSWVKYPGLSSHPTHANALKQLVGGFGSVLAFGVRGGEAAARQFINHSRRVSILAHVSDANSLVIHPWTTTHEQLSETERRAAGASSDSDLVRLSIGLEDVDDLLAALDHFLHEAAGTAVARAPQLSARSERSTIVSAA